MTHQGDVGGSTNSITWLTRGLAERGHEVFLACRRESLIASRFRDEAVTVVETEFGSGLRLAAQASRWRHWLREHRIDVVNAHASLDRHLVSYVKLLGTPTVVVHTRRNVAMTSGGRLRAWFDRAATDAIIAVSADVGDDLARRGVGKDRVTVVRNGLPLADLPPADPAAVARLRDELAIDPAQSVVGVVARRKSQPDLLRAATRFGRPLTLLFAGTDEDDELRALARDLPAGSRMHCLGFRDDVPNLRALFDVFVLPSEIEGFSLALLEAMACGLPCIATDVGGNREALANGTGILVPPGDADALAKALASILGDRDASREMGSAARERALREFDVRHTIARTEALYERLCPREAR
jgi:glycosyltransferase involved in cell wall biosynthesis